MMSLNAAFPAPAPLSAAEPRADLEQFGHVRQDWIGALVSCRHEVSAVLGLLFLARCCASTCSRQMLIPAAPGASCKRVSSRLGADSDSEFAVVSVEKDRG